MITGQIRSWTEAHGWKVFIRTILPIMGAISILIVVATTKVSPNLLVVKGTAADVLFCLYAGVLVSCAFTRSPRVHTVGVGLAVLCFGGRGAGFLELVFLSDATNLLGAGSERIFMAALLVAWHISRTRALAGERI
jgi:hypothetical protein